MEVPEIHVDLKVAKLFTQVFLVDVNLLLVRLRPVKDALVHLRDLGTDKKAGHLISVAAFLIKDATDNNMESYMGDNQAYVRRQKLAPAVDMPTYDDLDPNREQCTCCRKHVEGNIHKDEDVEMAPDKLLDKHQVSDKEARIINDRLYPAVLKKIEPKFKDVAEGLHIVDTLLGKQEKTKDLRSLHYSYVLDLVTRFKLRFQKLLLVDKDGTEEYYVDKLLKQLRELYEEVYSHIDALQDRNALYDWANKEQDAVKAQLRLRKKTHRSLIKDDYNNDASNQIRHIATIYGGIKNKCQLDFDNLVDVHVHRGFWKDQVTLEDYKHLLDVAKIDAMERLDDELKAHLTRKFILDMNESFDALAYLAAKWIRKRTRHVELKVEL